MYEMRPGLDRSGTAIVWHVKGKRGTKALCQQWLTQEFKSPQTEEAGHCPMCMASFAELVEQEATRWAGDNLTSASAVGSHCFVVPRAH
jgi:hypothetical protein